MAGLKVANQGRKGLRGLRPSADASSAGLSCEDLPACRATAETGPGCNASDKNLPVSDGSAEDLPTCVTAADSVRPCAALGPSDGARARPSEVIALVCGIPAS